MNDERKLSTQDIAEAADRRDADVAARALDPGKAAPGAVAVEGLPHAGLDDRPSPLFGEEELSGYRARWGGIQTGFVDEPRKAVEEADALVAELMKRLAEVFSGERNRLESQWGKLEKVSTEDLRLAMRRYRSFFERLLSI